MAADHREEFHAGTCSVITGPKGGVREKHEVWRVNGKCQTWKTRPEAFSLPLKYGFKGPYTYLTQDNAADFHAAEDCIPEQRYGHGGRPERFSHPLDEA